MRWNLRRFTLDDLIGDGEQSRRDGKAECFGRLEVDRQFELRRLLHRQIGGFSALEQPIDVNCCAPIKVVRIDAVRNQTALLGHIAVRIHGREPLTFGLRNNLDPVRAREGVRHDDDSASRIAGQFNECGFNLRAIAHRGSEHLNAERRSRDFDRLQVVVDVWRRLGIEQQRRPLGLWRDLFQQFQPFAADRRFDVYKAGDVAAGSRQALNKTASDRVGHQHKNDRRNLALPAQRCNDRRRAA